MSQSVSDTVIEFDITKVDLRKMLDWLGTLPINSWWVEKDVLGKVIGLSFRYSNDAVIFRLKFGL